MNLTILQTELNTDPVNLGYAALISSGYDQSIADLLNNISGAGAAPIQLNVQPRGDFLISLLPAVNALSSASADLQSKWDRLLQVACSNDSIAVGSPAIKAVLDAAAQDGIITTDQRASIGMRIGSRAEVLLGAGTIIVNQQI